jgi:hypothetical protein
MAKYKAPDTTNRAMLRRMAGWMGIGKTADSIMKADDKNTKAGKKSANTMLNRGD